MALAPGGLTLRQVLFGSPASDDHQPEREDWLRYGEGLEELVVENTGGKWVSFSTKAEMDSSLAYAADTEARVYDDGANNGVYKKVGASGSGLWSYVGPIPESDTTALEGEVSTLSSNISDVDDRVANLVVSTGFVDDPQTLAILGQLTTPLTKRQELALQTARKRMEAANLWLSDAVGAFGWAGYSTELAALNWMEPDGAKAAITGSHEHIPGVGYVGHGAGQITLGINPASVPGWKLAEAHLGVYMEDAPAENFSAIFSVTSTDTRARIIPNSGGGNILGTINAEDLLINTASPASSGHFVINRNNSVTLRALHNGVLLQTTTSADAIDVPTQNFIVLFNATGTLSCWHAGSGLMEIADVSKVSALCDIIEGLRAEEVDAALVGGVDNALREIDKRIDILDTLDISTSAGMPANDLTNRFDIDETFSGSSLERFLSDDTGTTRRYRRNTATSPTVVMEETFLDPSSPDDILILPGAGQSLEDGGDGSPALTITPTHPYRNFKLDGGWGNMTVPVTPEDYTFLQPLAQIEGGAEKPIVARLAYIQHLVEINRTKRYTLIGNIHALGGASIDELNQGTVPYANGLAFLDRSIELASSIWGRGIVCPGIFWTQGESDRTDGTSYATYVSELNDLIADYNTDYKSATGQTDDVVMWMSQLSAPQTGSSATPASDIALAQLDVCLANSLARMTGPRYWLPFALTGGNGPHLTNQGYRHLGEMDGKAWYREHIEGEAWEPLRPVDVALSGATVTLTFNRTGLEFDVTTLPERASYGFEYGEDGGASGITITNVAITADDEITLTLSGTPNAGNLPFIRYAYTAVLGISGRSGAWGNVKHKDTAAPSMFFPSETVDDWLIVFKEMLS